MSREITHDTTNSADTDQDTGIEVLLIAGSLRRGSYTRALLEAVQREFPPEWRVVEPDLIRSLPFYDADLDDDDPPIAVVETRRAIRDASLVVIATPEYNGAVPGGLKNLTDWTTRPPTDHVFVGKPVAILSGAPNSKGAVKAAEWLRSVLGYLGAEIVADPVVVPDVATQVGADGTLAPDTRAAVERLVAALTARFAPPVEHP